MRSLAVFLTLLSVFPVIAKKNPKHLKSSVFFYKNISEDDINGWEKDFFKDFDHKQPISFPDMDILTDNEIDDEDVPEKIPAKKHKFPKKYKQILKVPVVEKVPEVDTYEEQYVEVPDLENKQKKPVPEIDLFPETVDEDNAHPDNEVDRSGRIRKMKELLKKRKGKRRIDKRLIH